MDFSTWSAPHTVIVIFAIIAFIGQVGVYFYKTRQNDKQIAKLGENLDTQGEELRLALNRQGEKLERQGEELRLALHRQSETFIHALERLEDRMDKRITETTQRITDLQADMNQRLTAMQSETNQRFTDVENRFTVMDSRLSDIETGIRQLNQNHVDHLTHHTQ